MEGGAKRADPAADGLLIDLAGTLYNGDQPIDGARRAIERLAASGIPLRFVTNTTSRPRSAILDRLAGLGFTVDPDQVLTAPQVAAKALAARGIRRCHFLLPGTVAEELDALEPDDEKPQAVVVGDLGDGFTYERLNRGFRLLLGGAQLVALAGNRYFKGDSGMTMDVGAFVAALEYAAGCKATVLGKPAPEFFKTAVADLGRASAPAMVGDDLECDVLAAQAAGLTGVLVRTGKFRQQALTAAGDRPDHVIDSIADLPALLGLG